MCLKKIILADEPTPNNTVLYSDRVTEVKDVLKVWVLHRPQLLLVKL